MLIAAIAAIFLLRKQLGKYITEKPAVNSEKTPVNTAINPTAVPVASGVLFVTGDGLAPKQIVVKKGEPLRVENNTDSKITVKTTGIYRKDIEVDALQKTTTQKMNSSGEIKAWLPGTNAEQYVLIQVK